MVGTETVVPRRQARSPPRLRRWMQRLGVAVALGVAVLMPSTRAHAQTAEGTVITNTARVTWTDANNNTYTAATATVSVTVGFQAGLDVTSPASVTPASPSTGNSLNFTINNVGNGVDSVAVSVTSGAGITVTGYAIGATTYPSLAALNLALSQLPITAGGNVVVTVVYDVAAGRGGLTSPLAVTATSRRTPATSDVRSTNVRPPVAAGVAVTPDASPLSVLPSNGTQYTAVFTITNNGNAADSYNLAAVIPGGLGAIVSVNGTAGTSGTVGPVAAGGSVAISVVYTVANAAAGSSGSLQLTATSQTTPAISDAGSYELTVVRPTLRIVKAAFRDDQTTAITGADRVVPGEFIMYRITVTNTGSAAAQSVSVTDALPAAVTYQSASPDAAGWTLSEATGTVTGTLAGTLAPAASRFFWVRVRIN